MKQTPNYNLNKLEGPDTADLTQFNPNWDTLDGNLKQLSDDHVEHLDETAQDDDVHGLKTLFQNQQFENLIKNSDFASWSAGDNAAPDGWVAVLTDVAQRVSGQYFPNGFRFQGAGNSYAHQIVIPSSEIQYWRGKTVTFGGWIKSTQGNIWMQDEHGTWESRQTAIVTSGDYEFVTKTTIIPETWIGRLVMLPYAHNGAEIIVEGLFMVKGELPVAFAKNPKDYVAAHLAETVQDNDVHGLKTLFQNQQFVNLVEKGDFPDWSTGDVDAPPDGWLWVIGDASNTIGRSTTTYISAPACAYLVNNAGTGNMSIYKDITDESIISRLIGRRVTQTAYIKASAQGASTILQFQDENNSVIGNYLTNHSGSGNFERVISVGTVPTNTARIRIIALHIFGSLTGTTYVDDVMLVEGELPVAFARNPADDLVSKDGDRMTGHLTLEESKWLKMKGSHDRVIEFLDGDVREGYLGRLTASNPNRISIVNSVSGKGLSLTDDGRLEYHGKTIWRADNDGAGSGMDADTVRNRVLTDEVDAHVGETMPHRFVAGATTYRWGSSVVGGVVMFNYEEVV